MNFILIDNILLTQHAHTRIYEQYYNTKREVKTQIKNEECCNRENPNCSSDL